MRVAAFVLSVACALVLGLFVSPRDASTAAPPVVQATPPAATARAMPRVATPLEFTLPSPCSLSEGGAAVRTGENGSLIHWIAECPGTDPADMSPLFASALAKQGWTTASVTPALASYRRGDLELLFEFTAPAQPATSYVWFGQRYWH